MEKKSKTSAKEVKMTPAAESDEKKLSYEELENLARQLNQQCGQLYQKLQEAEKIINNFNDIGLLLSIIKQGEYFEEHFTQRCTDKVQKIVTDMLDSAEKKEETGAN